MKTFKQTAAQGDIYIERVRSIPTRAVAAKPAGKHVVVAHSETGHHHVMSAERTTLFAMPNDAMVSYLHVQEKDVLRHLRSNDTHEGLEFPKGRFRVTRQREHVVGTDPVEKRTRAVQD